MKEQIELIVEKFQTNFNNSSISEENTKQGLIEPILQILGWNLSDTSQIRREYKNVVDYALFNETTTIYLEAKTLNKELNTAVEQVYKYAISHQEKPDFVIVSNGMNWKCYSMKYNLEIFSIDLLSKSDKIYENLELIKFGNIKNGILKNYANYINVEHQVFAYLNSKSRQMIDEIIQSDNSMNKDDVNKVLTTILNKKGNVISVSFAKQTPSQTVIQIPPRQTNNFSNYNTGFGMHSLDNLPLQYLMILDNFAISVENHLQSKVENIYIGKTGKREWSDDMSSPYPNYFVECKNGDCRNNRNGTDYNRNNCVRFSYSELKEALKK